MVQPPGFIDPNFPLHVCKLKKSICGLKQAPRAWYKELQLYLLQLGFFRSKTNPSLFILQQDQVTIYFLVYVDDLIIIRSDSATVNNIICQHKEKFSLKNLGLLHYFLSVEVIPCKHGLFLTQHKYIRDLLVRTKMEGAKQVKAPLASKDNLVLNDGSPPVDATKYRRVIGGLQYLALTRPNSFSN